MRDRGIRARYAGALIALSVAAFAHVTSETLPIGLLELISRGTHSSLAAVGLLVTSYGLLSSAALAAIFSELLLRPRPAAPEPAPALVTTEAATARTPAHHPGRRQREHHVPARSLHRPCGNLIGGDETAQGQSAAWNWGGRWPRGGAGGGTAPGQDAFDGMPRHFDGRGQGPVRSRLGTITKGTAND